MTQQQYTPVSWQDETTSQQGTLINAERLNQMQTAHHYADGLEETDTVPTADPGVDYHKVVYCTADNTLYRWDGTQWTADIDDPTRELLEEHEADHDNPHQVTKAQVGLGNCDNTSDADKPVSTATQAALDGKADKATTLAGYGITDAYTKSQDDALLANKADKADTYTKAQVDGYLGGKVDKLGSSPAGTYRSVTVNAQGQVTAGTNPDTLAGYGITDAYTKGEADTLLAGKADVATTLAGYGITDAYTETETDTLLAAKANDNAVVHLAGNEDIGGTKTFTQRLHVSSVTEASTNLQNRNLDYSTPNNVGVRITMFAKGDITDLTNRVAVLRTYLRNGGHNTFYITQMGKDDQGANISSNIELHLNQPTWGNAVLVPSPASNAPSNAVATLATLDGYAPMVRTTGNQEITGSKVFSGLLTRVSNMDVTTPGSQTIHGNTSVRMIDKNGVGIGWLYPQQYSDGRIAIFLVLRNRDGTSKFVLLGTSD